MLKHTIFAHMWKNGISTGEAVGTGDPHSSTATSMLETLFIGNLTSQQTSTQADPATSGTQ